MKSKLAIAAFVMLLLPLLGLALGCSGADNPKIAEAPEPPPSKPEEATKRMIKVEGKSVEYGSNPKYKKAMDRLNQ